MKSKPLTTKRAQALRAAVHEYFELTAESTRLQRDYALGTVSEDDDVWLDHYERVEANRRRMKRLVRA